MSTNKRYYWLKLNEDFFEDDTINWLEEQENGKEYVIFYLKLCLKSLKDDGKLIRYIGSTLMPYDVKALSRLTSTPPDTVAVAMEEFFRIGLVSRLHDGEIYMNQINEMIGSETDVAKRVRQHRARKVVGSGVEDKLLQSNADVTKSNTEIEIEIDKDKESKKESTASTTLTESFEKLWSLYPNKKGKKVAFTKYKNAVKEGTQDVEIEEGIKRYLSEIDHKGTANRFVKHGSTWFSQQGWEDDYESEQTETKVNAYWEDLSNER